MTPKILFELKKGHDETLHSSFFEDIPIKNTGS